MNERFIKMNGNVISKTIKTRLKHYKLLACFLFFSNFSFGQLLIVPDEYDSIQHAITAAEINDTILIRPGTYNENIIIDKGITITSNYLFSGLKEDITGTVINGGGKTVITVENEIAQGVSINGLSITYGDDGVSALSMLNFTNNIVSFCADGVDYEDGSGGLCLNNTFSYNSDDGIDLDGGVDIEIINNIISENADDGIEIRLHPYSGNILKYRIERNSIYGNGEDGIQLIDYSDTSDREFLISHNYIYENQMAGIASMADGNTVENYEGADLEEEVVIINNTVASNNFGIIGGNNFATANNILFNNNIGVYRLISHSFVANSLFFGNGTDHLNSIVQDSILYTDPLLTADFSLQENSPCIDAGKIQYIVDLDTIFFIEEDQYSGNGPDIGAFEYVSNNTSDQLKYYDNLRVVPNPVGGLFSIYGLEPQKSYTVEIYTVQGELVYSKKKYRNQDILNIGYLAGGIYFIKIGNNYYKIIKI